MPLVKNQTNHFRTRSSSLTKSQHIPHMCEVRAATSHQFNSCYDVQNDSNWIAVDRKHTIVCDKYTWHKMSKTALFLSPTECRLHLNSHTSLVHPFTRSRPNKDHNASKGLTSRTLSNVISIFVRQVAEAFKRNCVSSKSIALFNSFTLSHFLLLFFFLFYWMRV